MFILFELVDLLKYVPVWDHKHIRTLNVSIIDRYIITLILSYFSRH